MSYFNRFDVVAAHYLFLNDNHEGQGSWKYRKMCAVQKYYWPGRLTSYDALNDNAKAIYDQLMSREYAKGNV